MPVEIYADGAASPNPGPGGYGTIVVRGGRRRELSGGFRLTTNNRMEIRGVIEGLRELKASSENEASDVIVYSDSRYLVDMFNGGYARKWRCNGWMLASRKKALNIDLWTLLLDLTEGRCVRFEWIRGHNGHAANERCDELAVEARRQEGLPADDAYERSVTVKPRQMSLFGILDGAAGS